MEVVPSIHWLGSGVNASSGMGIGILKHKPSVQDLLTAAILSKQAVASAT
jgi:hypothetical protein